MEGQYDATKVKRAETVLKDILAEHGHQFAIIKTDVKTIPPASVQINFTIKEGPTVKVGEIQFAGNEHLSSLYLRRSMKKLKPIGIPYSLIFENLFARTFDASKLDTTRSACARLTATRATPTPPWRHRERRFATKAASTGSPSARRRGKRIDILMPVEEGARYRLGTITFTGNKHTEPKGAPRAVSPSRMAIGSTPP